MQDAGAGVYTVTYTPESVGGYVIPVKYGGDEVPASPFHVRVAETGDASKVKFLGQHTALSSTKEVIYSMLEGT